MLRALTNGFVVLGLLAGLMTSFGSQATASSGGGHAKPSTSDEQILELYNHFDPSHLINTKLLRAATLYFHKNKSQFANQKALTIIDFSLHSSQKRFFVMNTATGEVWATYTSHGNGSDPGDYEKASGFAKFFSNVASSNQSSLGAYMTDETYSGKHGYSLRLRGLSDTNSNAFARAIVVHGASYVVDEARKQGRSEGCPALPMKYYAKVINLIKGRSLIFAGASAKL